MSRVLRRVLIVLIAFATVGGMLAAPALAATPTITSFTPGSGGYGAAVTINGTGFAAGATARFGASAPAATTFVSSTKLTAKVPLDATTGPIHVITSGGTATSSATFTVTPWVTAVPAAAVPGAAVTLSGGGFGSSEAVDIYVGTSDAALVTSTTGGTFSTSITIPATATPGTLWLSAAGRHSGRTAQKSIIVRTNWAQLGGGANRQSFDAHENVLTPSSVSTLDRKWTFPAGAALAAAPAVWRSVAYFGDDNGNVYAVNIATGKQLWTRVLGGSVDASPAVFNSRVYIADDHALYALNAYTGATVWNYSTGTISASSPAFAGGSVYFGFGADIYALNPTTGAKIWSYVGDSTLASPTVAGGRVFVGSNDGTFYALDAGSGVLDWSTSVTGDLPIRGSAAVVAGIVYVGGNDGVLRAYVASTGRQRWAYNSGNAIFQAPAVAYNTVYYGDIAGYLYALSASSGELTWSVGTGDKYETTPVVANNVVYAAGSYYGMVAFDAQSSEQLWQAKEAGDWINAPPVVNDGHVFAASENDDTLTDFEPSTPPNTSQARPRPARLHPDRHLRVR